MIGAKIPLVAAGVVLVCGCAANAAQRPDRGQSRSAETVVTREHWNDGLAVVVGDTFRVPLPLRYERWTVVYSREILRLLSPPDRAERPGPEGWRFEAIARGATDVTFTGFAPPDDRGAQPNVPKFILRVTVR